MFKAEFGLVEVPGGRARGTALLRLTPPQDRRVAPRRLVLAMRPARVPCVLAFEGCPPASSGGEFEYRTPVIMAVPGTTPIELARSIAEVACRRAPRQARGARCASIGIHSAERMDLVGRTHLFGVETPGGWPLTLFLLADRPVAVRGALEFEELEAAPQPASSLEELGLSEEPPRRGRRPVLAPAIRRGTVNVGGLEVPIAGWSARVEAGSDGPVEMSVEARAAGPWRTVEGESIRSADVARVVEALQRLPSYGLHAAEAADRARDMMQPLGHREPAPMPDIRDPRGNRAIVPQDVVQLYRSGVLSVDEVRAMMGESFAVGPGDAPKAPAAEPEPEKPRVRRIVLPHRRGEDGL